MKSDRHVRGVLFDLFGTLVAPLTQAIRDEVAVLMAGDLGVDGVEFAAAFKASYQDRCLGRLGDVEQTMHELAARCGGQPLPAQLRRAAERRLAMTREFLTSDPETLAVLAELKRRGLRLGLVSDCSLETPTEWPGSPLSPYFDCAAFSCLLAVRKPDPRIYQHVLDELGLKPDECLYVGDGDSSELSGALRLGIRAIRICRPGSRATDRYSNDADFNGAEIVSVAELL
jgi:putative hydrolase of the HAD superfamily